MNLRGRRLVTPAPLVMVKRASRTGFRDDQAELRVCWEKGGEPCWVRTSDLLIKSQLLYRLS